MFSANRGLCEYLLDDYFARRLRLPRRVESASVSSFDDTLNDFTPPCGDSTPTYGSARVGPAVTD